MPLFLGTSLVVFLQRATGASASPFGLLLLLTGIAAAYSFDRLIDPPKNLPHAPDVPDMNPGWLREIRGLLFLSASGLGLWAAAHLGTEQLIAAAALAGTSLLYLPLKRLPLAKTVAVAGAWVIACTTLPWQATTAPANQLSAHSWHMGELLNHLAFFQKPFVGVTLPLFLLMAASCILCDLKDRESDLATRVLTLPVLVGPRLTGVVAGVLALVAAGLSATHANQMPLALTSLALAVTAQFTTALARAPMGSIVIDGILTLPGLLSFFW